MEFVDRQIACMDCGQPFVFTAGEQEFYERKGFREEPKRCKPCRDARKARRNEHLTEGARGSGPPPRQAASAPGPADDDDIGNRAPSYTPRESRPTRDLRAFRRSSGPAPGPRRAERELFDAVCAQCGAPTRVPFRPVAGRPVYCRDCFGARAGGGAP
jgi:CxxC-x17-CxxC domain-containing protein